jgi:hypothetical protein
MANRICRFQSSPHAPGVGCITALYAIRDAVRMRLLSASENSVNGLWNRPNTISIVCGRWLRWLRGRSKKPGGWSIAYCFANRLPSA